jgi:hypothetical protein
MVVTLEEVGSPEADALHADAVSLALLVVLGSLTPAERLAFVLHDLFDLPFEEIASVTGRSAAAVRQQARATQCTHGVRVGASGSLMRNSGCAVPAGTSAQVRAGETFWPSARLAAYASGIVPFDGTSGLRRSRVSGPASAWRSQMRCLGPACLFFSSMLRSVMAFPSKSSMTDWQEQAPH